MSVDPTVVAFLADERLDLDPDRPLSGSTFDGEPLTPDQRALIIRAAWDDLDAAGHLRAAEAQALAEKADAFTALLALGARYAPGPDETLAETKARMSPADAAEYDRLAELVAPAGYVLVPVDGEP